MNEIKRVRVDLGERILHLAATDAKGGIVERKRLPRLPGHAWTLGAIWKQYAKPVRRSFF